MGRGADAPVSATPRRTADRCWSHPGIGPSIRPFSLADLDSRLRAAQIFAILPLDDADRAHAIERLATQRGLELGADVVAFILRRAPRRMDELIATFDRLDRGSLAQQRRLTIPLAKDVLGL